MYQMHPVKEDYLARWQKTADVAAAALEVPAALVLRVWPEQVEVLVSSLTEGNPYPAHWKADLGLGLYCETVMANRTQLMLANALEDPAWRDSPCAKQNMISYLGVPLLWPDGTIFGAFCVLDSKTRHYSLLYQKLLWQLKEVIEAGFNEMYGELVGDQRLQELRHEIDTILVRHGELPRYASIDAG